MRLSDDVVERLRAFTLDPGQKLILELPGQISAEQAEQIMEQVEGFWPKGDTLLIAGGVRVVPGETSA